MENLSEIGTIAHFYSKIEVSVIDLTAPLKVGDTIVIKGSTTDLEQMVDSMQVEHQDIEAAESGQSVGLKAKGKVREGDTVYKKV
ncbi:MAG: translation elongation factor-like protein [Candidatus Bathyarchaeota archaeon]|nr:translation elongation factor-like protein [Candidatus Bathyarchaeota archaeon]